MKKYDMSRVSSILEILESLNPKTYTIVVSQYLTDKSANIPGYERYKPVKYDSATNPHWIIYIKIIDKIDNANCYLDEVKKIAALNKSYFDSRPNILNWFIDVYDNEKEYSVYRVTGNQLRKRANIHRGDILLPYKLSNHFIFNTLKVPAVTSVTAPISKPVTSVTAPISKPVSKPPSVPAKSTKVDDYSARNTVAGATIKDDEVPF